MINFKICFYYFAIPIAIGIALASCKNTSTTKQLQDQTEFKQPVSQPLKFSETKKIDWADIEAVTIQPLSRKLDFNKLPAQRYDSSGFKPYKYPVEEVKFDYNALPQKDFDVDKLPSKPLKFKTFILPPPKLIKAGLPRLKISGEMSLFEFGEAQGVMGNVVSCTFTDRDGFVWIATNQGIYRYDGENLLLYLSSPDGHIFYSIMQDDIGQIWVGEFDGGINILDINNGILKKTGTSGGLASNKILWMMEDTRQRIWVSFYPGSVNIIDPKTQTVRWFGKKQGLSDTTGTGGLAKDKNNNIWISTAAGGLQMIDLQNHKIRYLDKAHGLQSDSLSAILCDHKGRMWISSYGKMINVLDFQKNTIQTIKEMQDPRQEISDLIEDDQGRIWISTFGQGVEIIDPEKRITKNLNSGNGLNNNVLFTINQDQQGRIWMPTITGLNMMVFNTPITNHFTKVNVTGLAEDNQGLIWLASFNEGMYILDRKTGISRHLDTRQGISSDTLQTVRVINGKIFILSLFGLDIIDSAKRTMTRLSTKQGLNNKKRNLNGVITDRENRIWIGSNDGLDVYDPKNRSLKHLDKTRYLNDNIIKDMAIDSQGMVWLSTRYGGINVIDPNTWTIRYLNNVQGIRHRANKVLMADDKGNMWIGTDKGIYIANLKKNTLTSFSSQQGLIDDKVNSFIQHNAHIYVGTEKGITIITPPAASPNKKWEAESFGKAYGIIKENSTYYETDIITRDGLYWWGDAGITLLDLSKKDTLTTPVRITGMNVMDQPKHFVNQSDLKTKNRTLVNAGYTPQNGLSWDSVTGPDNMPVNLQLPYDKNFIQFHYNSLNLLPRDTASYRYILIGADQKWSDVTNATFTNNYINLQPGKYTFEVVSRNRTSQWSKPAKLNFIINPPWWQTWWAYFMYVFLFVGTIWCFVTYRSYQLIKDKRVLEHKVHIRTEEVLQQKEEIAAQRDSIEHALDDLKHTQTQLIQSEKMASLGELTAGIAHEIQNPLNFINNFADVNTELLIELQDLLKDGNINEALAISDDIKQNEEKINHHGKRADSIVKGMLQHSRASSTTKEPTDVNKLVDEYLRLSYHGLRAKDKTFNAGMITRFDDPLPELNIVQQDIGRVMLNLFNNAFYAVQQKQKTAGKDYKPNVEVSTSRHNGFVEIKVSDNGTGIPDAIKDKIMQPFFTTKPTGEGTGLGLSLTYDMVVKGHGGNINVESKEGEYTEFTIALPLS